MRKQDRCKTIKKKKKGLGSNIERRSALWLEAGFYIQKSDLLPRLIYLLLLLNAHHTSNKTNAEPSIQHHLSRRPTSYFVAR